MCERTLNLEVGAETANAGNCQLITDIAGSDSSIPPRTGGNRNVQGGRSMGAIEEVGFGEGLCPPTGSLGVCPRKFFFKI